MLCKSFLTKKDFELYIFQHFFMYFFMHADNIRNSFPNFVARSLAYNQYHRICPCMLSSLISLLCLFPGVLSSLNVWSIILKNSLSTYVYILKICHSALSYFLPPLKFWYIGAVFLNVTFIHNSNCLRLMLLHVSLVPSFL